MTAQERKAAKRKRWRHNRANRHRTESGAKVDLDTALGIVPDDLPDGAWMAMLCELTGGDAGDVATGLAAKNRRARKP